MKIVITMLLSLTIVSCGANRGNQFKDPELTNVIMQAANDLESRSFNTSKIWTNVDSWEFSNDAYTGENGRCDHANSDIEFNLTQADQGNHVTINREMWNTLNIWERKELLIHELAHCAYGIEHSKYGLMNPELILIKNQQGYDNILDNFVYGVKQ